MAKMTEAKNDAAQHVIIYGEPKTGKTKLAGDLAKHHPLIWFDLENGHSTLFKLPKNSLANIELINLPDTQTYPIGIETINKVLSATGEVSICDTHGKVSCAICKKIELPITTIDLTTVTKDTIVVIDSISQLASSTMAKILKNTPEDAKPEWSDYSHQGTILAKLLSILQHAKYNVVCITHVTETYLEDKTVKLVPMCGSTNFSRNTAKYFDHVILTEVKNKKHIVGSSTDYSMKALTGSRTDVALEKGGSIEDIFKHLIGNKEPIYPKARDTETSSALADLRARAQKGQTIKG